MANLASTAPGLLAAERGASCGGMLWRDPGFRRRLRLTYGVLAALNLGTWAWAFLSFHERPVLLSVALVIYGLGLRHALDADHIAAIDNVTRKLMQSGARPVAVGFFFAVGHASVVILVTAAVLSAAIRLGAFRALQGVGGIVSIGVSAGFLLVVAGMNMAILASLWTRWRRPQAAGVLTTLPASGGLISKLMKPLFRLITRSWQMLALGFLFGLGFDTATEVAVFGVSAAQSAHGLALTSVLVFPLLFAAGMALVDTTDGVLMLGAYEWAFVQPTRKRAYDAAITAASAAIALLIGGVEALGLLHRLLGLRGWLWDGAEAVNGDMNRLGLLTVALFLVSWLVALAVYRLGARNGSGARGR